MLNGTTNAVQIQDIKLLMGVIILHFLNIYCSESIYSMFEDKLKMVSLNNLNKYLCNDKSEIKVNINMNSSSEKLKK